MLFSWLGGICAILVALFVSPHKFLYGMLFGMCAVGCVLQFCFCCMRLTRDHNGVHYNLIAPTGFGCLSVGSFVGIVLSLGGVFTLAAATDRNHALISL